MNIWAEDISENIIVRKMSWLSRAGHLTVPCYSLSHFHRFVHSLGTLAPDRNTYCAIYHTYAAIYLPISSWQTFSFHCWLVWVLLAWISNNAGNLYTDALGFLIKKTNKQSTQYHSIFALRMTIYNGVVSGMIRPVLVLTSLARLMNVLLLDQNVDLVKLKLLRKPLWFNRCTPWLVKVSLADIMPCKLYLYICYNVCYFLVCENWS